MKIAITGGAGFIGSHIARAYLDAGHDVFIIDTLASGSRRALDPRARFYQLDIRDGKLLTVLQKERPDIVSHHAAQRELTHPNVQCMIDADIHIRGTLNVLEACVSASVSKVIFASGGNTLYGSIDLGSAPITEHAPLQPLRPYDISKLTSEWYIRYYTREYNLNHTILRYADVYGEQSAELAQHPLSQLLYMLAENQHLVLRCNPEAVRDHIFIDDVVRANLAALKRGQNQTFHISSGTGHSVKQLSQLVGQILEREIEPIYVSSPLAEALSIALSNRLAQHLLGWHPEVDIVEGIKRLLVRLDLRQKAGVGVSTSREVKQESVAAVLS